MGNFPIVKHAAQFFGRTVQKVLLFFREFRGGHRRKFAPVGTPAEQFTVPPDSTCLKRFTFRVR